MFSQLRPMDMDISSGPIGPVTIRIHKPGPRKKAAEPANIVTNQLNNHKGSARKINDPNLVTDAEHSGLEDHVQAQLARRWRWANGRGPSGGFVDLWLILIVFSCFSAVSELRGGREERVNGRVHRPKTTSQTD